MEAAAKIAVCDAKESARKSLGRKVSRMKSGVSAGNE